MNFYWTWESFETHWFWQAKKNLPRHPTFNLQGWQFNRHGPNTKTPSVHQLACSVIDSCRQKPNWWNKYTCPCFPRPGLVYRYSAVTLLIQAWRVNFSTKGCCTLNKCHAVNSDHQLHLNKKQPNQSLWSIISAVLTPVWCTDISQCKQFQCVILTSQWARTAGKQR